MERIVLLPLYGRIDLNDKRWDLAWDLLQSQAMQKLHDNSLSSIPSQFIAAGMPTTRFQHSLGVMLLADRITTNHAQWSYLRNTFICAAALHDVASPPFSHIAEPWSVQILGHAHEEEAAIQILTDEELLVLFAKYNVDVEDVAEAITGKHPILGPLLAGDLDADSIDNSLGLLTAFGGVEDGYNPLAVADLFYPDENSLPCLKVDGRGLQLLLSWRQVRIDLYNILASEPFLSASTSLFRALNLATPTLDKNWIYLGEHEALQQLKDNNDYSRRLIERMSSWKHLHCRSHYRLTTVDNGFQALPGNMELRGIVEDELAKSYGLQRDEIAVYAGYSRRNKEIKLPFTGECAQAARIIFTSPEPYYQTAIFTPSDLNVDKDLLHYMMVHAVKRHGSELPTTKTFF